MTENKLTIIINRPISEVFDFTITPSNTPRWIDSIVREEISGAEIKVGTQYTNESKNSQINIYVVEDFKENELFQLRQVTSTYHVRYIYKALSADQTELEYFEWVDNGTLEDAFEQLAMEKLKEVLEQ